MARIILNIVLLLMALFQVAQCFVVSPSSSTALKRSSSSSKHCMLPSEFIVEASSTLPNTITASHLSSTWPSLTTSAITIDPATFLTDLLGAFISTPIILAVPIVAALGVATLLAYLIVSYANPAEPNDD